MTEITEITTVPNHDSRRMHPLPWQRNNEDKCTSLISASGKIVATFWGNDERMKDDYRWPTEAQRFAHVDYAEHACNAFPIIQAALEEIYSMEDMPEEAIKKIEAVMAEAYFDALPPAMGTLTVKGKQK